MTSAFAQLGVARRAAAAAPKNISKASAAWPISMCEAVDRRESPRPRAAASSGGVERVVDDVVDDRVVGRQRDEIDVERRMPAMPSGAGVDEQVAAGRRDRSNGRDVGP